MKLHKIIELLLVLLVITFAFLPFFKSVSQRFSEHSNAELNCLKTENVNPWKFWDIPEQDCEPLDPQF